MVGGGCGSGSGTDVGDGVRRGDYYGMVNRGGDSRYKNDTAIWEEGEGQYKGTARRLGMDIRVDETGGWVGGNVHEL